MASVKNPCNGQWGQYYEIHLDITLNSQDIASNTSNVNIHLWAQSLNSAYHAYNLEGQNPVEVYVNSSLVDTHKQNMDFRNLQVVELSNFNRSVAHNADGTGSVNVSGSFTIYGTTSLSSGSVSGTMSLPTIPRTSQMEANKYAADMETNLILYTKRKSTSFTHTFEYSFGKASGVIATNVGDSFTWKIPITLADQIPNALSGTGTIKCTTYSGSTRVGTSQVGFQANVPSNIVPSTTISSITENTSGLAAKFAALVKGKSTLSIRLTGVGNRSSSIQSYKVTVNGATYSGGAGSGFTCTTGTLRTAGTNTISATVTDSRGRTATTSKTFAVIDYSAPAISALSAFRCDANGTANAGGSYMKISYNGSIYALNNKNDKTFTVFYKESTTSSYTTATTYTSGYTLNTSIVIAASTEKSYDILFRAKDYFHQTDRTTSISTAFVLMDLYSTGTGISFGKVAESSNLFDVGLPAHFRSTVRLGAITNLESYVTNLNSNLGNKANTGHTHDDRYFTESEMNTKLNGKANSSHTHDDRYYTEGEINTKLNAKFDAGRIKTHSWVTYISGTSLDVNFSQVGLVNNVNYAIHIVNANRAASTITVLGVSLNKQPPTAFRIYWDDNVSQNVQFHMLAVQL